VNIELKPIAESKIRQLGGEVFGVVIRDKRGRFAAITEMGFVTWLDEDKGGEYAAYLEGMNSHLKAELEAARAHGGEVEPVAWRDLEIGELKRVGDRFLAHSGRWVEVTEDHFGFEDSVTECTRPMQRRVLTHPPAPAQGGQGAEVDTVYVDCRECDVCGHAGINDSHESYAACHRCDWSGPEPEQDRCPGCDEENCMAAACPECSGCYVLIAEKTLTTQPQPAVPEGWKLVPVEPTTEMRYAYHEAEQRYLEGSIPSPDGQWWAMLDAAPQPPAGQEGKGDE
jgi:hypothetical protein